MAYSLDMILSLNKKKYIYILITIISPLTLLPLSLFYISCCNLYKKYLNGEQFIQTFILIHMSEQTTHLLYFT